MARSTERARRSLARAARVVLLSLVAAAGGAGRLRAQAADDGFFARLGLDRLRLTAVGVDAGRAWPSQVDASGIYALHAEYGGISGPWRIVFTASYWGSNYDHATIRLFEDSLRAQVKDPAGDDTISVGRIALSDITLGGDLRWYPFAARTTFLRPYAGGGIAAHVINAEGKFIAGTLMERALDDIATGVVAVAGLDVHVMPRLTAGVMGRYDLVSGARFPSVRVGVTYHFDPNARRAREPEAPR